jgi:hypothetical protein
MRSKDLTATIRSLRRVLADPRLVHTQRERLRKSEKELEKLRRSGKLDRQRLFLATSLITDMLVELLLETDVPTDLEVAIAQRVK